MFANAVILEIFVNLEPNYMSMKSLGEILKKHMGQTPVGKQVAATFVVEKTNETIRELFGVNAKKFAQAVYFKDKTIAITCLSSVMAQEIKLNEKKIVALANNKLGAQSIEKVRYLF